MRVLSSLTFHSLDPTPNTCPYPTPGTCPVSFQVELPATSLGHYGFNTTCNAQDPPGVCTKRCYGPTFWLYGAQLRWDGLRQEQRDMRNDTSALLQLKQAYPGLFHNNLCRTQGSILEVQGSVVMPGNQPGSAYAPYVRFEQGLQAAVVVSNPSNTGPLRIKLDCS